jgi:hypothetical protein
MSFIKFGSASIKKRWFFQSNIIYVSTENEKKEYTDSSYYTIIYKDNINYDIIKKAIKPFEGFLKQGYYQVKNNKKFLNYTLITGEGIGTKNNKIVIHSLLDKVCYELLLTEQDDKNSVYTFAWNTTCMTEKEAIELTVAFLK